MCIFLRIIAKNILILRHRVLLKQKTKNIKQTPNLTTEDCRKSNLILNY